MDSVLTLTVAVNYEKDPKKQFSDSKGILSVSRSGFNSI
jgi:hypothetical protein